MTMLIISANYLDRSSEYKYLVREQGKPVSTAKVCKAVSIDGPSRIEQSSELEEGFGCRRVCVADSRHVTMTGVQGEPERITFDGYDFRNSDHKKVDRFDKLELNENGIFAVVS